MRKQQKRYAPLFRRISRGTTAEWKLVSKKEGVRAFRLALTLLPYYYVLTVLLSAPVRSRAQLLHFCFQVDDLFLLLFDRVEHRPEDRVAVDHQVAPAVLSHSFGNNLLKRLSSKADMFPF